MRKIRAFAFAACLLHAFLMLGCAGSTPTGLHDKRRHPAVTAQPDIVPDIATYFNDPAKDPPLQNEELVNLLRQRIRYVFIIFNENHSFDNEYGTFPGVNGIYSDGEKPRPAGDTPGFTQTYTDDVTRKTCTVRPFLLGPGQNSSVMDSVDHSNEGMAAKIHVVNGVPQMDGYAEREYHRHHIAGAIPTPAQEEEGTQFARLVMSHVDCNTIPLFWHWAGRFTIFDNIFATEDGPSTPNAVAMISGQMGQTQWVKHLHAAPSITVGNNSGALQLPPLVADPQPFWGSQFDTTTGDNTGSPPYVRQPLGASKKEGFPYPKNDIAANLTFATLPLTFQGKKVDDVMIQDANPTTDLADIRQDIPYISKLGTAPVNWGWYQEGYGLEDTDTGGIASHSSYVSHHNGAQYFGYISNTPAVRAGLHGLTDFFTDMKNNSLPESGVFYIRGGYKNLIGKNPVVTDPNTPNNEIRAINAAKGGDDDHPSYTDRQLSEAMAARVINAIASNPGIWNQCAIIITYDETDGLYDHVPPRILSYGPDKLPLSRGSRVPLILISPYARTHAVSHVEGDHNSIIETINYIFGLPALASLPDEAQALKDGNSKCFNQFAPAGFEQKHLGPNDINSPISESLLSGFDPKRLMGAAPPLPASFAVIPEYVVNSFPHFGGNGCREIGIVPEDVRQGIENHIPEGFNPLPGTYPTTSNPDAVTY
jgi:phospholipase C